ncbi:TadE/TadG family type IV pilus assembly protein [Sphingomonas sp. M1-B02]|uniref:TadE/TadG family type IV pilus assembly protein n=1 Tax=Sphingomonas sp. M1-B02 TaxID=3114300 RepID=UPI00223F355E|nr:TadE/TadG family type IV pilus assembly protein [Sphingomonas sp. S6-11]UZK66833.1 pilus assembly protein [Sphingomonas sp. S6-11]
MRIRATAIRGGIARRLVSETRGATVIEFAIVAPVLCMLLVGAFDVSHTLYMRGVLQGVVQKTARDSSLESGTEATRRATLDGRVRSQVGALANNATVTITREYYRTFSDAAAAQFEPYTDTDGNNTCNGGEPYEDNNNNQNWDASGGNSGQGGAKDAVLYSVTVSYPRFFPIYRFIGGSNQTTVKGSTVLRNQPYGDQAVPKVRNCA